jgi:hypothetical protein
MPRQQTPAQRGTIGRVMHEFKHGDLKTARGKRTVRNPKQAIAIALREAGASEHESPAENRRNLRRTKEKERHTRENATKTGGGRAEKTRAELYEEAKKRGIPGRSQMNKAQLARALHR